MGSKKESSPPPVDQAEVARQNAQAQIASFPLAAEAQFNVRTDPRFGELAQTQLSEDIRREVFPGEQGVREQLVANIHHHLNPHSLPHDHSIDTSGGHNQRKCCDEEGH